MPVPLTFEFTDPAVVAYLQRFPPDERGPRLQEAARIGILALNSAAGGLDTRAVEDAFRDAERRMNEALLNLLRVELGPGSPFRSALDITNNESAFSKMQEGLSKQLSLDNPESAISRLRKLFEEQNAALHQALGEIKGQKEAVEAAPTKGVKFEDAIRPFLDKLAQPFGDLLEDVSHKDGPQGKQGDYVVQLEGSGPKIVLECKKDRNYSLMDAQRELQAAKRNRSAQAGIFVFAKGYEPREQACDFRAIGEDVFCTVDESSLVPVFLDAAYKIARAKLTLDRPTGELDVSTLRAELRRALDLVEKIPSDLKLIRDTLARLESYQAEMLNHVGSVMRELDKKAKMAA